MILIKYIEKTKKTEKGLSLVDIILDFCNKFDIEIELIGDAISSDNYFKSFIESDCKLHKIFKSENPIEGW